MRTAWQGSGAAFLARPAESAAEALIAQAMRRVPGAAAWHVALDARLPRPGRRLDALVVLDRAVVALRVADGTRFSASDRRAVEDAALDLADGHAGCAGVPVVPVLCVPGGINPTPVRPLPLAGAGSPVDANRLLLPVLLREVAQDFPMPARPLEPASWMSAP
jgi:hypothetical protein